MTTLSLIRKRYIYREVLNSNYVNLAPAVFCKRAIGEVLLSFSGKGVIIVYEDPDTATVTWYQNYTNPEFAFDYNPDSYASKSYGTITTDAVLLDYNNIKERYIIVRLSSSSTALTHRLYVSTDGSTWNLKLSTNNTSPATFILVDTFRFLKLDVSSTSTGTISFIYEISAFSKDSYIYYKALTLEEGVVNYSFLRQKYTVVVEPNPYSAIGISVFERAPISSVEYQEVEI